MVADHYTNPDDSDVRVEAEQDAGDLYSSALVGALCFNSSAAWRLCAASASPTQVTTNHDVQKSKVGPSHLLYYGTKAGAWALLLLQGS
jgi:hypothetical protein